MVAAIIGWLLPDGKLAYPAGKVYLPHPWASAGQSRLSEQLPAS